jgi:serine/threonine protein kinase
VWAFGCLLFEMLTGKKAFEGEDVSDTLAAILRGEPDWSALPADVPPALRTLIKRCLERDRRSRIPDLSVVRFLMADNANADLLSASGLHVKSAVVEAPHASSVGSTWLVAAISRWASRPRRGCLVAMASRGPPVRVSTEVGANTSLVPVLTAVALSSDGTTLTFVGADGPIPHISSSGGSTSSRRRCCASTEGASAPFSHQTVSGWRFRRWKAEEEWPFRGSGSHSV